MRTIIQALSLLLFSTLFVLATYKLPDWLPADIYLRSDPLLGINAVFAAREIIGRALWALVTIGATLVIGRFFCAYICPMGGSIDFLDIFFFRKKKREGVKFEGGLRKVKYFLLIIFITAAITGFSHGPHSAFDTVLYFLHLSSCDHSDQPRPGFTAPLVSGAGMGHLISPPLFSVGLLHDGHYPRDFRRDHCSQSSHPTLLVSLSLSIGSFSELDLTSWTFQAPGQ